jgi:hypothetical protein
MGISREYEDMAKKNQSYSGDLEDREKLIAWFCSFQQFATKPVKN